MLAGPAAPAAGGRLSIPITVGQAVRGFLGGSMALLDRYPRSVAVPASRAESSTGRPTAVIPLRNRNTHCAACGVRELCLPAAFTSDEMDQFDALVAHRTRLQRNDSLYRAGDKFHALYAIQFGSLKTVVLAEDGREQVTGYHILGEIIGFDGIGAHRHCAGAIALENAELCALPFASIETLARAIPALQRSLHRSLSAEIARDQNAMLMLGRMRAEERLAVFLLDLAERYRRRGYSSTEFVLRMTRKEIGSHLGIKLETVSRLFSRFQGEGLIQIQGRAVKLLDPVALKQLVGQRGQ
jgi:CRP/FNR family transcriptional regulator, anaerobic regulatory protein